MNKKKSKSLIGTEKVFVSENVYARFIKEKDKRKELAIILNDDTTSEQLRNAWPKIAILKEQLFQHQGSDPHDPLNALRLKMATSYLVEGLSYAEIALEFNHDCLVGLCKVALDIENGTHANIPDHMFQAQIHLKAARMKDEDVASWTWGCLKDILDGRAPWTLDRGPISKQRIRDAIRQFEREHESEKFLLKEPVRMEKVAVQEIASIENPGLDLANRLLEGEPNSGGLTRLSDALTRALKKQNKGVENPG